MRAPATFPDEPEPERGPTWPLTVTSLSSTSTITTWTSTLTWWWWVQWVCDRHDAWITQAVEDA